MKSFLFLVTSILIATNAHAVTVSNLQAVNRNGQTFLTWQNNTTGAALFRVYRSSVVITNGSQIGAAEYLGEVNELSAVDFNLTAHDGVTDYLVIDSSGSPLASSTGLFVALTEANGQFFYAVTIAVDDAEDTNILPGINSLQASINEKVTAPVPIFRESRVISGKVILIYTDFISMKCMNGALMNKIGMLTSDFAINLNNARSPSPLRMLFHPGGQDFLDGADATVENEILISLENELPNGESTGWFGANEQYEVYAPISSGSTPPADGINYNFMSQHYKRILDWAEKTFPVDSNRVYLDGTSSGALGAYFFTLMYPESIAATKINSGVFNLAFQDDYNPDCSMNTGKKNRTDGNLRFGTVGSNLMTNVGYHTYDELNGGWWIHRFAEKDLPVIYSINGKQDAMVGWTEKVIYYDSVNANHAGGYYFWDNRGHDGNGKTWDADNFNLFRYRKNSSYPAFANCSANENPGDGNGNNGAWFGSINGYLDWDENIVDNNVEWEIKLFTRDLRKYTGEMATGPDSCMVDITPRRLQFFHPQPDSILQWKLLHRSQEIQSGSLSYHGGSIVIPQVKIFKDSCVLWVGYAAGCTADASFEMHDSVLHANASDAIYEWIDCATAEPIAGATDQDFTPSHSGNYALQITEYGCSNTSLCFAVSVTGIYEAPSGNSLAVFPNPFTQSTVITYEMAPEETVSWKIFDMDGRLVKTLTDEKTGLGKHQLQWNATDEKGNAVSAGIYFLKIQSSSFSKTEKLMVVK